MSDIRLTDSVNIDFIACHSIYSLKNSWNSKNDYSSFASTSYSCQFLIRMFPPGVSGQLLSQTLVEDD